MSASLVGSEMCIRDSTGVAVVAYVAVFVFGSCAARICRSRARSGTVSFSVPLALLVQAWAPPGLRRPGTPP
eukprot:11179109-Alexandrium_andersonii.AAC.1